MDVFRGRPCNPFPYEFAFELLVKGPCLLAGREVAQALGWANAPQKVGNVPLGWCPSGPSTVLGRHEPPFSGSPLHSLPVKKSFSHPTLGLGPLKVTPRVALSSSGTAASLPREV